MNQRAELSVKVVISGRHSLGTAWSAGGPVVQSMVLSGFPPEARRTYLRVRGVGADLEGEITRAAGSNPLALGLGLPFFSRNHLVQVVGDLELLGYRVSMARIEERDGARPSDAGSLFRDEAEVNRQARVVYRSTARSRRRAAAAPAGTAVVQ